MGLVNSMSLILLARLDARHVSVNVVVAVPRKITVVVAVCNIWQVGINNFLSAIRGSKRHSSLFRQIHPDARRYDSEARSWPLALRTSQTTPWRPLRPWKPWVVATIAAVVAVVAVGSSVAAVAAVVAVEPSWPWGP